MYEMVDLHGMDNCWIFLSVHPACCISHVLWQLPSSLTGAKSRCGRNWKRKKDVQYFWAFLQPVVIVHLNNSRGACNFFMFINFWCIYFPYSCPIFSWVHINLSKIFQMSAPLLLLLLNLNACAEIQVLGLEAWLMLKHQTRMRILFPVSTIYRIYISRHK